MEQYIGAIVTLLVGLTALEVYRKQKRDNKKTAARILLIEIENAERQLQIINENGEPSNLAENIYLMPSSSWSKYRHLFAQDFSPREWDTITNFYNKCLQFDDAVKYDNLSFKQNVEAYRNSVNLVLALKAGELTSNIQDNSDTNETTIVNSEYLNFRDNLTTLYMSANNLYMYSPQKAINDAVAAIKNLDKTLSLTTIGTKLRRVSRQGFWARVFNHK